MRWLGGGGEAARAVGRQRRFDFARLRLRAVGRRSDELLEFGQEGLPAGLELDLLEVALAVEHAVGQGLFVRERVQHAVLDGVFRHQVDDGDRRGSGACARRGRCAVRAWRGSRAGRN